MAPKKTAKPKVPAFKNLTAVQQVNQIRNMVESGTLKVSDLDLPKNQQYRDALENYYGQTMELIASDETGSLMGLFSSAITKGMTDVGFANSLKKTKWYLKYDASNRAYQTALNNPAAQRDLATKRAEVIDAVQTQAMSDAGKRLDDATAASIAEDLLRNNYENWQTKVPLRVRSSLSRMNVTQFGGTVLNTNMEIRNFARSMGISVSDQAVSNYMKEILAGNTTIDAVQGSLRKQALPYYPQFADRINAGDTVADITAPYRNMIASMLEVDENSIGFDITGSKMDPILLKALSGEGGKPVGLYDLRKMIKQDSRWQYTRNAEEEYAGLTTRLMRMFGAGV